MSVAGKTDPLAFVGLVLLTLIWSYSWIAELEPEHQTKYLDIQRRTSNTPVSQSLLREFVSGL